MSTSERPAKRVRQACDPCRRKKSRCPGEKPVCSYCARLSQQCTYSDEGLSRQSLGDLNGWDTTSKPAQSVQPHSDERSSEDTTRRLNDLESKLSEVLAALHESRQRSASDHHSPAPLPVIVQASPMRPDVATRSLSEFPSSEKLAQIADLYLRYCHCQPLSLFASDRFSSTLSRRDEEVVLAVAAIALRFSPDATTQNGHYSIIESYIDKARSLTMQRINRGLIELSTLQSLCLLSWLDFYNANTHQASILIALASDLCRSSGIVTQSHADEPLGEEKLRCFWSIILLQRLHPNISGPFYTSYDDDGMPAYPLSKPRPAMPAESNRAVLESRVSDHKDLGIVAYAIQLTEVWYRVARYAHRRASAGTYPPWSSNSEYAKIIDHQMEGETAMPYSKHRFKPAKFEERTSQELVEHREYWGPWIFTQLIYHTIICVLNHPLLLSLRLRHFRVASIPEIWLQHTDDLIAQHSQWVIHLIDLIENKSFVVSDPFLAHCVAIVATIHLQRSFKGDGEAQQVNKENFIKCLQFCQRIGEQWTYIEQLAKKLQDFEHVVSESYHKSAASQANDKIFIDLSLFWEILESATISRIADTKGLRFGQSLRAGTQPVNAAEELNARLLPEPSRILAAGSPANGIITYQTPTHSSNFLLSTSNQPYPLNEDFNVLAQNYFAQGQDFVGNMDDWWLMDDTTQGG